MKKNKIIIVIFLCFIFFPSIILQGCSLNKLANTGKITAPLNELIPISGVWEIYKYKIFNKDNIKFHDNGTNPDELIGKHAAFKSNYAVFLNETCEDAQYKIKEVDAKYYFFYTYKINLEELDISNKNVEVISVTSEGKLFYDVIKVSDNEIILYVDNIFYFLKKVSDNPEEIINKKIINKLDEHKKQSSQKNDETHRSGVLIGLRSNTPMDYSNYLGEKYNSVFYRTIWISAMNKELYPILETPNLFAPRISGFWWIGVKREEIQGDKYKDNIFAYPVNGKEDSIILNVNSQENTIKKILFIGNDYIGIESKKSNEDDFSGKSVLKVLPTDKVSDSKGVKISDILEENGRLALNNSAEAYLASQNDDIIKRLEKIPKEESFTMIRKNGHWIMRGRLQSKNLYDYTYADFNINMVPTSKIINYDDFYFSWNDVKERVPDAVDAYASPNKDLAIIINKNYIYVYGVEKNVLTNTPLKKIAINNGESVVMAEWATGDYMERWEKAIKSTSAIEIK
ncbi:hypothetical protein [Clostridium rectalis]|uniref:hypothetical protein n=1 Tax=Clostridium rectalis TaxID=2040295 RepID=UPI000F631D5E|nr:hypothetical protein [Clostridium rectalis]